MKTFFLTLVLSFSLPGQILLPLYAGMPPQLPPTPSVISANSNSGFINFPWTISVSLSPASGHEVTVFVGSNQTGSGGNFTVMDNLGNTLTRDFNGDVSTAQGAYTMAAFHYVVPSGGVTTYTETYVGASCCDSIGIAAVEFNRSLTFDVADTTGAGNNGSPCGAYSWCTGTITTTNAHDTIVAYGYSSGNSGVFTPASYTAALNNSCTGGNGCFQLAFLNVSSIQTTYSTGGGAGAGGGIEGLLVAFKYQ